MKKIIFSLIVVLLSITLVDGQQINCPDPISFPIKASGTDVKFQSLWSLELWNRMAPMATSISQVLTNAENMCTSNLGEQIAKAVQECFRYCTNVPQCNPQTALLGINSCQGNSNNNCHVENRPIYGLLYNPHSGFYTTPLSANFPAWVCNVNTQTSLGCECV